MVVPKMEIVVSVKAVLILFSRAGSPVDVFVDAPTTKPAAIIAASAVEPSVPCSYARFGRPSNSGPNCLLELP
jgi:hypothetical protein